MTVNTRADKKYNETGIIATSISCVLLAALYAGSLQAAPEPGIEPVAIQTQATLFARVGDMTVTLDEYTQSYNRTIKKRYYHSKPPESELETVRKEVGDSLINRLLLVQEAKRKGLKPDHEQIQKTLQAYDDRYKSSARWQEQRDGILDVLGASLEEESLLAQLEADVRNVTPPNINQLQTYYKQNLDKFTEPMRQKLSVILLTVDPSSTSEVWQAALDTGQKLVADLHEGASFEEYAQQYSGDPTAPQGGDMGYLHRDMLSEAAQQVVDGLEPGEISNAVRLLQGVAILRLDDRTPEQLRLFEDVKPRVEKLWLREQGNNAWADIQNKLRLETPVTVYIKHGENDSDV
jgi:parvulin-like peptidyl-prolyl isomerase